MPPILATGPCQCESVSADAGLRLHMQKQYVYDRSDDTKQYKGVGV